MERENRQTALHQLLSIAATNGYVTFDDIMRCADDNSLSIGDFDWLSEAAGARNIIIYDEAPKSVTFDDDEFDDYAQIDYERIFTEAVEMSPALESLMSNIRSIIPPQRGEVARLKYQVKEGNIHARDRMIEMYLRLAVRIAVARSKIYDLDLEETVSDAFVGLLLAVDKYDPDYSGPFVSFASLWIYQNMSREQSTKNPNIYFPVHRKEWFYTMYPLMKGRGCTECDLVFQCEKVINMICERIPCSRVQAHDVLMASIPSVSWNELAGSAAEDPRLCYSDDEIMENIAIVLQNEELYKILDSLTERQREVLTDRYGLKDGVEKTLDQIGQKYGLTRERIRQIEAAARRKVAYCYTKHNK